MSTARSTLTSGNLTRDARLIALVLENLGDGVIVADAAGRILYVNPAAERVLGVGRVDAPPEEWADRYGVFYPDAVTPHPSLELPLARALRGEETDQVELFIRN